MCKKITKSSLTEGEIYQLKFIRKSQLILYAYACEKAEKYIFKYTVTEWWDNMCCFFFPLAPLKFFTSYSVKKKKHDKH